jgi:hypothetical protein
MEIAAGVVLDAVFCFAAGLAGAVFFSEGSAAGARAQVNRNVARTLIISLSTLSGY